MTYGGNIVLFLFPAKPQTMIKPTGQSDLNFSSSFLGSLLYLSVHDNLNVLKNVGAYPFFDLIRY